ncbi:ABC transporter substrate-binding protein [Humibacter albus]|uniref:ABC transporter substrate-binding protein n=1 Tax=Humibacter albus TaxID=427754 RepID=UPI0003B5A583|nr:ABC transporter substrate-binding protein [Humibacter albus]
MTSITLASQANEGGFPLWLAQKLGYFADNNLEVKITYAANGAALLGSGAAGDWQAGWIGSPPAITGYQKFGLITVGTEMHEDKNLKLVMPKSELAKSSPAEILKTGKVGTTTNSTWSQVLYACANKFGVDPSKLNIVPLDSPAVRQALIAGQIQAGTTDSSGDYDLLKGSDKFKIVCNGAQAGISIIDPYVVTPKFANSNPKAAAGFTEAVYRANEYIDAHHSKALDYMQDYYADAGIKGTKAAAEFSMSFRQFPTLDEALKQMKDGSTEKTLKATGQFFVDGGLYKSLPDLSKDIATGLPILKAAQKIHEGR